MRIERDCPWCGEPILAKARLCKHCQQGVVPLESNSRPLDSTIESGVADENSVETSESSASGQSREHRTSASPPAPTKSKQQLFLYVPRRRLILMSIVTFGAYEYYWIYRNWRFVKDRYALPIQPFWRGWFGIFYLHGVMTRIHDDPVARGFETASFSTGLLSAGWVILTILTMVMSKSGDSGAALLAVLLPSYLFLVPVQNYVNRVTLKRDPAAVYYPWSGGHILLLVLGSLLWLVIVLAAAGAAA